MKKEWIISHPWRGSKWDSRRSRLCAVQTQVANTILVQQHKHKNKEVHAQFHYLKCEITEHLKLLGFWTLSVLRYCWQNLMFGKFSSEKVGETSVELGPAGRTVLHRVQRPCESQLFLRCNIHPVAHEATNNILQRFWK